MHLVGFIIIIYHAARSPERQRRYVTLEIIFDPTLLAVLKVQVKLKSRRFGERIDPLLPLNGE